MSGWPERPLGELIDLFDYRRVPLSSAQRQQRQGEYPYYGAQGIIDWIDDYIFDGRYLLIPEDGENLNSRKLPIAYFADGKFWVNNHAHIARARPGAAVDRFIQCALQATNISGFVTGAAQPKLNQANLLRIPIRCPDVATQRRVAAVFDALDGLIENNTRRIEILEEMAQAIYREWFVNFRYPGHEDVPLVDSELGPIPDGWRICTVADLCDRIQSGGTPRRTEPAFWDGGDVPWYKTGDLTDSILLDPSEFITAEAVSRSTARMFEPETILMAIYGSPTVGRLGLVSTPSSCNQAALGLSAKLGVVTIEYLWFVLAERRTYLNRVAQGAAQQNVSKTVVCSVPVVLPPHELAKDFTDIAGPPWRLAHMLTRQNRALRATRDLLLPRLISGEVDVSGLDIEVGELVS